MNNKAIWPPLCLQIEVTPFMTYKYFRKKRKKMWGKITIQTLNWGTVNEFLLLVVSKCMPHYEFFPILVIILLAYRDWSKLAIRTKLLQLFPQLLCTHGLDIAAVAVSSTSQLVAPQNGQKLNSRPLLKVTWSVMISTLIHEKIRAEIV